MAKQGKVMTNSGFALIHSGTKGRNVALPIVEREKDGKSIGSLASLRRMEA